MANSDKPNGLRLIHGTARPDSFRKCAVNASYGTALAVGMPVKSAGTLNVESGTAAKNARTNLLEVVATAAGDTNSVGVIVSIDANPDDLTKKHIPASTGGVVTVCEDPFALYIAQEDSDGGALAAVDAGQLIDIIDAGVSATGVAGVELDSSTKGASGQFQLLELHHGPNNEIGTNAKWIVRFAEHRLITDAVAD